MLITIDAEFKRLIPALLPEEFKQLEANILSDGGIKEPLSVWGGILLDGHNRYKIAEKHDLKFATVEIELSDRDHAKLWIATHQLGRRNLTDDQRADIANEVREIRSLIARSEQAKEAVKVRDNPSSRLNQPRRSVTPTRKAVAIEAKLPERKIRLAQEIKKVDPVVSAMVRAGDISLVEGRKIVSLPAPARAIAVKAVEADIKKGDDVDVRAAIRTAKKQDYDAAVAVAKPKKLEGTYRIIYADPPWKYSLNSTSGIAEDHYDCLTDEEIINYKPGNGTRLVKALTDKNAVLFLWTTSPFLEKSFAVIHAWGFEYKASFVWDKVRHNMGYYNSVRHEFLLVATKGSGTPDVPKLVDSVQVIEKTPKHSEKPEEFRKIIEGLYNHGRKLELFRRGKAPEGWDADGNETE